MLAVIGLIIGAVAIGKDVQRNAEYTKIKNKFIDQWEQAYNQYYQRTGVVVGDSQTAPRIMVNRDCLRGSAGSPTSGGDMAALVAVGSEPVPFARAILKPGPCAQLSFTVNVNDLRAYMTRAGIRMRLVVLRGRKTCMSTPIPRLAAGNPGVLQWNRPTTPEGPGMSWSSLA